MQVTAHANGPLVVTGRFSFRDGGDPRPRSGETSVAICRCGGTATGPLCDGAHTRLGFRAHAFELTDGDQSIDAPVSDGSAGEAR